MTKHHIYCITSSENRPISRRQKEEKPQYYQGAVTPSFAGRVVTDYLIIYLNTLVPVNIQSPQNIHTISYVRSKSLTIFWIKLQCIIGPEITKSLGIFNAFSFIMFNGPFRLFCQNCHHKKKKKQPLLTIIDVPHLSCDMC